MTSINMLIWKLRVLWKRHYCTCFLCVRWCLFSAFWRTENAIYGHRSMCLKEE